MPYASLVLSRTCQEYLGSVCMHLSRPPGSPATLKWYTIESHTKFCKRGAEQVAGRLLLEMQTYTRESLGGQPFPWEEGEEEGEKGASEVPELALEQVFWWRKGTIHLTVVSAGERSAAC